MEAKVVQFDDKYVNDYSEIYDGIVNTFAKFKSEKHKTRGLSILRKHMVLFHQQTLAPLTSVADKEALLAKCSFMTSVTSELLVDLQEYFESVRDEAQ